MKIIVGVYEGQENDFTFCCSYVQINLTEL